MIISINAIEILYKGVGVLNSPQGVELEVKKCECYILFTHWHCIAEIAPKKYIVLSRLHDETQVLQ